MNLYSFNEFFSSTVYAQAAQAGGKQPSIFESLVIPLGAFLLIMFFLVILPQQKKAKEHNKMLGGLKPGDEVVTSGGILGRVKSVADTFVSLDIGSNATIKVLKTNISGLTKTKEKESTAQTAKASS